MAEYITSIDSFRKSPAHEQLEAAIAAFHAAEGDAEHEAFGAAMDAILALMDEKLILPVEDAGAGGHFNQRMLRMNGGENVYVAFTDVREAGCGPETRMAVQNTEEFFSAAITNEIVTGVILNPWSEPLFIDKELIRRLFAAMIPEKQQNLIGFLTEAPSEAESGTFFPRLRSSEVGNGDILWHALEETKANDLHLVTIPTLISDGDGEAALEVFLHTLVDWLSINAGYFMAVCFVGDESTVEHYREVWENHIEAWNRREIVRENNGKLEAAIAFAMECHRGATAKGTDMPYILHPMEAVQILTRMNADINLLCAGVLHDTLEDTDATLLEIYRRFGADVAALVNAHTEDKRRSWYYRKLYTLTELPMENSRVKMCAMADKVSNLRRLWADYKKIGDELWARFNAPKEMQAWYYSGLVDAMAEMRDDPDTEELYWEMNALYKDIFVRFYLDSGRGRLFQIDAGGEGYVLMKGDPTWQPLAEPLPEDAEQIARRDAERMEDNWNEA